MKFKPLMLNISIALITIYILFGLFLFLNQKSLLYYPNNQNFEGCSGFSDYQKMNHNGTRFYFKQGAAEKVIIYYHGNAGSACDRSYFKSNFKQSNASLIFVEYSGYSGADEKPSQKLILKDVENIHNYVQLNSFENVLVYGESIGSGAASYHVYLGNVNHLILVTPFSRLVELVQSKYKIYPASILLTEKYDNRYWLQNYNGDLIIFHGDHDLVIPSRFSQELFEKTPSKNKEYVLISGKGHNDIYNSAIFESKLIEFIRST